MLELKFRETADDANIDIFEDSYGKEYTMDFDEDVCYVCNMETHETTETFGIPDYIIVDAFCLECGKGFLFPNEIFHDNQKLFCSEACDKARLICYT